MKIELTNKQLVAHFDQIKRGREVVLMNYQAKQLVTFVYDYDNGILPVKITKDVYATSFKKR